jgi:hypothetical protein
MRKICAYYQYCFIRPHIFRAEKETHKADRQGPLLADTVEKLFGSAAALRLERFFSRFEG